MTDTTDRINPEYVAHLEAKVARLEALLPSKKKALVYVMPPGVRMSPRLLEVFHILVNRPDETLSREVIFHVLYEGRDHQPAVKIIDVLVSKIRQEFREAIGGKTAIIETVHRSGYRINPDVLPFLRGDIAWDTPNHEGRPRRPAPDRAQAPKAAGPGKGTGAREAD